MIKIIFSLFTIYELSLGNRLLLQGQGTEPKIIPIMPIIPPAQPQAAATTAQPQTVNTAAPVATTVASVVTSAPIITTKATTYAPWTPPQQAATTAVPVVTLRPTIWTLPVPTPPLAWTPPNTGGFQAAPPKLECIAESGQPGTCSMAISTITNPTRDFELLCKGRTSCAGGTINIFINEMGPPLEELKGLWFTNVYAGAGAFINIINNRPGNKILISEIKCDADFACMGTQFMIGEMMELEVGDFYCAPNACGGCVVKKSPTDPSPTPCRDFVEPV